MKREIEKDLKQIILNNTQRNVIVVEGARQVGKSYLVNRVLNSIDKPVLSFDLEKDLKLRKEIGKTENFNDFKTLMEDRYEIKNGSILFLDEAQESKKLAKYIKSFKEDWKEVQVILTGSSMNRFFDTDTRIPVGRTKTIRIFTFSFSEFVEYVKGEELADYLRNANEKTSLSRHNFLLELFDIYMQVGGYPEAVIAYKNGELYTEIIDDILFNLEEDFLRKEEYKPLIFKDIIKNVANHIGSQSKLTHFNTTKYYAKKIIEALIGWHILLEVEQGTTDTKRINFLPKRYLFDIGVVNRKRALPMPSISILNTIEPILRTPLGGLFENALLLNLVNGKSSSYKITTWKKGRGSDIEVDFVYEMPKEKLKIPIECKATLQIKSKHYKNLLYYLRLTGNNLGILVSAAPFEKIITKDEITILNIPIYLANSKNIKSFILKHSRI